jgi:type VI secretion system protein ImpD
MAAASAATAAAGGEGADCALARALLAELGWPRLVELAAGGPAAVTDELDRRVAALDAAMGAQLDAVLHHPRFQRLEGSWRGLAYLVDAGGRADGVKIRVLSAAWREVARDLERAIEFDQSQLFAKIYSAEFGMPGGEPYGLLVADYFVRHTPGGGVDDVAALRGLAGVAAAAFAPTVLGAAPELLGLDRFADLQPTLDVERLFQQGEYGRWRALQGEEDTRFLGVVMPPVVMRGPHADDGARTDGFRFAETVDGGAGHVWANPAYAFAAVVVRAFDDAGWFADIRGTRPSDLKGGLVTDLPALDFATDAPGVAPRPPLQVSLSYRQERALSDQGLIALTASPYTPYAILYSNTSLARPSSPGRGVAQTNARMASMLNYVLCASRFAHYLKVLGRDMVGSVATAGEVEAYLHDWLADYAMTPSGMEADPSELAARPLGEASVQVRERPGRPGSFTCVVHLRPHYQLDDVVSTFRLTTELAPAQAA